MALQSTIFNLYPVHTYPGSISDGLRHGQSGVFKCSAGQEYEGGWDRGQRCVLKNELS